MNKRQIEVSVISDLHLGTHACKPKQILDYLKSIQPEILVLNGDIIDSWRFSRNYFPKNHLKIIRQLIKMMEKGSRTIYVTGNHDEFLRKFSGTRIGKLEIVNQFIFHHEGQKTWIFHGDIFDEVIHNSKGLAKFGAALYGFLSIINNLMNRILKMLGKNELIIYKNLKKNLLKEKAAPSKFESQIGKSAVSQGYNEVICGHTHIPKTKVLSVNGKPIHYINCGDWVEHFTAAEFYQNQWHLYTHRAADSEETDEDAEIPAEQYIYQTLIKELTFENRLSISS